MAGPLPKYASNGNPKKITGGGASHGIPKKITGGGGASNGNQKQITTRGVGSNGNPKKITTGTRVIEEVSEYKKRTVVSSGITRGGAPNRVVVEVVEIKKKRTAVVYKK